MKRILLILMALVLLPVAAVTEEDPVLLKYGERGDIAIEIKKRLYELQYYKTEPVYGTLFNTDMRDCLKTLLATNDISGSSTTVRQSLYDFLMSDECKNRYGIVWNETADYRASENYTLLGDEQYTVSSEDNVIVIVLDYFANAYLEDMLDKYPDALDMFSDFTYYNNCDPCYIGTYPSFTHFLTGYDYTNEVGIGQWFHDAWTSESSQYFYNKLKDYGYEFHLYTQSYVNLGIKNEGLGLIDNLARKDECEGKTVQPIIMPEFYTTLQETGLTVSDRSKFFIVQHLYGMHFEYCVDAEGNENYDTTLEDCAYGWLKITKAYLDELKNVGAYDDSTIIIMADHGDKTNNMQVIFFIKEANAHKDEIEITNAPISLDEFQSTILYSIGVPAEELPGPTVYDFEEDEERERTVMLHSYTDQYARVPKYNGRGAGNFNIWNCYTYTGDNTDLVKRIRRGPSSIVRMAGSFN